MFDHLSSHRFSTPPPASARSAYGHRRPNVDGHPSATTFVATLIMLVLATVSVLALIAVSPVGIAVPMAMLLIGGLIGGIVAMRSCASSDRPAAPIRRDTTASREVPSRPLSACCVARQYPSCSRGSRRPSSRLVHRPSSSWRSTIPT